MNNIEQYNLSKLNEIKNEIDTAYYDIPFGNTDFQSENFVIAAAITPARAYRIIGLQLRDVLNNLTECKYKEKLKKIEIEELKEKINDPSISKFERQKKEIELERLMENDLWDKKLVSDAIRQFELFYKHFKAMPRYTREQFEEGERLYFEQTQMRNVVGLIGAKESLVNMNEDILTIQKFEQEFAKLTNEEKNTMLNKITNESMQSLIEFKK